MADEGYHSLVALLALRHGWSVELSAGQNHDQIGRANKGTCLVAENLEPFSQLQCSRKSSGFLRLISCEFTPQLTAQGFYSALKFGKLDCVRAYYAFDLLHLNGEDLKGWPLKA